MPTGVLMPVEQHVEPVPDRLRPDVREAGKLQLRVHLGLELLERHARRATARAASACTVVFTMPIGELSVGVVPRPTVPNTCSTSGNVAKDLVLHLEQPRRLGDRQARRRRRHVEQRPFVERRHELAAEAEQQRHRQRHDGEVHARAPPTSSGARAAGSARRARRRTARPGSRDSGLQPPAADEEDHQHRHERDRQQRRAHHRERLGERQRPEHPALLRLEQEDRHERHDDDRQREEDRARRPASRRRTIAARLLLVRHGLAVAGSDDAPVARSPPSRSTASTSTPIASAMPPSDMMLDVTPR